MKKFEYLLRYDLENLNELGKEGWELVSVIRYEWTDERKGYTETSREFYFKREIVEGT